MPSDIIAALTSTLDIRELAVVGGAVPDELRRIEKAVRGVLPSACQNFAQGPTFELHCGTTLSLATVRAVVATKNDLVEVAILSTLWAVVRASALVGPGSVRVARW
jgi:hypothetical protein